MMKLNENHKNQFLDSALYPGEQYRAKAWGVLMADNLTAFRFTVLFGATGGALATSLANEYCYVGMTDGRLVFYVVEKLNVSQIKVAFEVPFSQIAKTKVKKSFIPGRYVIDIYTGNNKLSLSLMTSAIGTDIQNQKEAALAIVERMKALQ